MKTALPWIPRSNDQKTSHPSLVDQISARYDSWELSLRYVWVAGVKTAVYTADTHHSDTTLLFVHGIGGDHHGMMPLAYCLKDSYRIAFVDLPGHGQSGTPNDDSLDFLRQWSSHLLDALGSPVSMVIAHSFGCFSAQFMETPRACYINPPLSLTPAVLKYSLRLYSVRHLASLVYGFRPYALWRGQQLVHNLDARAQAHIIWVTDRTQISIKQFMFQARQARQTTDGRQLLETQRMNKPGNSFVLSSFDKISMTSHEQDNLLGHFPALRLPNNHLSIIESPARIADAIEAWIAG